MRVQATKKMANELNKAIKGTRFENMMVFHAKELPFEMYAREVSSNWEDMELDHNPRTGKYKTMRVAYNPSLYAMGQYVTTRDLTKIFRDIQFYKPNPTNDLILVKRWIDSRGREHYRLSAGYSWYHYA